MFIKERVSSSNSYTDIFVRTNTYSKFRYGLKKKNDNNNLAKNRFFLFCSSFELSLPKWN